MSGYKDDDMRVAAKEAIMCAGAAGMVIGLLVASVGHQVATGSGSGTTLLVLGLTVPLAIRLAVVTVGKFMRMIPEGW